MKRFRVVYAGTPEIARKPLESLIGDRNFTISFVITQKDKPAGRGQKTALSAVKRIGLSNKLIVYQPDSIKELSHQMKEASPDFLVVFAYAEIISKEILEIPKFASINIHPSLLPKYRGASPIQEGILRGDSQTGVTFIKMNEKLDAGSILFQKEIEIEKKDTTASLSKKLSELAAQNLPSVLIDYAEGKTKAVPQKEAYASYCRKITKEDGKIDFELETAASIERKIRAFTPWPGCYFFIEGKRIKITQADYNEQQNCPGIKIVDKDKITIGTKKGILIPLRVQLEGKKEMDISEFLKGYRRLVEPLTIDY